MNDFVRTVGDIDCQKATIEHAEPYRQALLDSGNGTATVIKKLETIKCLFQLALERGKCRYTLPPSEQIAPILVLFNELVEQGRPMPG